MPPKKRKFDFDTDRSELMKRHKDMIKKEEEKQRKYTENIAKAKAGRFLR